MNPFTDLRSFQTKTGLLPRILSVLIIVTFLTNFQGCQNSLLGGYISLLERIPKLQNAATYLATPTPDGSGQMIHPDLVVFSY